MTTENIIDIYANSIITFEIDTSSQVVGCKTLEKCVQNMMKQNQQLCENNAEIKEISFESLRDVIGIAKVLVKRMEAYIRVFDDAYSLSEYYEYLSGWYVRIEYMRLRGKNEIHIQDIINEISKRDLFYGQIVLEKMSRIQENVV